MIEFSISVGSALGFGSALVDIPASLHSIRIELQDGAHEFKSESFQLGVFHAFERRPLLGYLSFGYEYDEEARTVTVCGTDFRSPETMCLVTVPEGTSEHARQSAVSADFAIDDGTINAHWNTRTPLTAGLGDVLHAIARSANEALIAALKRMPGLIIRVRKHPPAMPLEDYLRLSVVYRNGEFLGMYEPGLALGPQDEVRVIDSVFGGEVTFTYQEAFANVIGSTNDPKIGGQSWLSLWSNQYGITPTICTSYNFNGFQCGNTFVGGHVIEGTSAKTVPKGSNSVYIFPICYAHNNNDNVYMEALQYLQGIWLNNYMGS